MKIHTRFIVYLHIMSINHEQTTTINQYRQVIRPLPPGRLERHFQHTCVNRCRRKSILLLLKHNFENANEQICGI